MDRACSNARPRSCVLAVILRRRIGEPERSWLLRVPGCESGWDPRQVTPPESASGLYQFLPSTWAGTPFGRRDIFSARWQAFAADWLYRQDGGGREWVCA